jgi:hypothetical protein
MCAAPDRSFVPLWRSGPRRCACRWCTLRVFRPRQRIFSWIFGAGAFSRAILDEFHRKISAMTAIAESVKAGVIFLTESGSRWPRVVSRDRSADGLFWYSVATTGVYRRPSCPSRTADPKNVRLHDMLDEARAAGFRPCKRCNPDGSSWEVENAASRQGVPDDRAKRGNTVLKETGRRCGSEP